MFAILSLYVFRLWIDPSNDLIFSCLGSSDEIGPALVSAWHPDWRVEEISSQVMEAVAET
jgi:hypothetical protein